MLNELTPAGSLVPELRRANSKSTELVPPSSSCGSARFTCPNCPLASKLAATFLGRYTLVFRISRSIATPVTGCVPTLPILMVGGRLGFAPSPPRFWWMRKALEKSRVRPSASYG